MERLLKSTETRDEAWTGLYNKTGENRTWHWSLPGLEYNDNETQWKPGEPNDFRGILQNYVSMNKKKSWLDDAYDKQHEFICYDENKRPNDPYCVINEEMKWLQAQNYCREHHTDLISGLTQLNELTEQSCCKDDDLISSMTEYMILIKENKTWEEALYYCRDHHYDLISITNANEQRWVQEKANNASSPYVWTGLRYTCTLEFWFWVSNEEVQYKNWKERQDECDMSGAMERGGKHQWYSHHASERFNFICLT
ncbi:hypothetical protein GBF38_005060 [Nibea albiflora]|uniref:Uncharacterized protein n=1 Tax=Nibea albiflora TaxID=240163 RepID=A0ACB7EV07_NIBAL|nr:hypothetical protein GBF38_005060 [Nibea albiflora]